MYEERPEVVVRVVPDANVREFAICRAEETCSKSIQHWFDVVLHVKVLVPMTRQVEPVLEHNYVVVLGTPRLSTPLGLDRSRNLHLPSLKGMLLG